MESVSLEGAARGWAGVWGLLWVSVLPLDAWVPAIPGLSWSFQEVPKALGQ